MNPLETMSPTDQLRKHFPHIIELKEPEETDEFTYVTFVGNVEDHFGPAMDEFEKRLKHDEYYTFEVITHGNTFVLVASRGAITKEMIFG